MGFYGNITNTSRTQFSFDKIYPNKYEMFNNAETDGIYVGRYVLVEYDTDTGIDAYPSTMYKYGNDMYLRTEIIEDNIGQFFILPPNKNDKIFADNYNNIKKNTIVRLGINHNFNTVNSSGFYIKILSVKNKESNIVSFEYTSDISQEDFINSGFNIAVDLTSSEFEIGQYYIKTENNKYELAEEYSENENYYVKGFGEKLYLCNSLENNFQAYLASSDLEKITEGAIFFIRKGYQYSLNTTEELWYFYDKTDDDNSIVWMQMISEEKSNYYKNFNIDKTFFPNSNRGYDSTVWQKVYHSGQQYYIMIAELNTVLPNLDISSDSPTLLPRQPYFSPDTTNVYYKISIQPQWGLRTKAASPFLLGDTIKKNGIPDGFSSIKLTEDEIIYPSDVQINWKNQFYNKNDDSIEDRYYNQKTGLWEKKTLESNEDDYQIKSAIYFNKDGFDSENINYSADLLDNSNPNYNSDITDSGWKNNNIIQLAPTGYSGYTYTKHNGSSEQIPQIDTQELSIMIPALGDSVAQMWDIIYGGRKTNDNIKETNKRNLDISWESANHSIIRNGLRLIKDIPEKDGFIQSYDNAKQDFEGNVINLGEINTLAGCINSVHDLMGMILVNTTENELQEESRQLAELNTFKDYKNIDGSKIYYFANDGTYRRKHETFEYFEVEYTYEPVIITNENFIKNFYYYSLDNGETFIPSYDEDFDENKNYYIKKINVETSENKIFIKVNDLKPFRSGEKHFPYQKTLNGDFIYDESLYAKDDETIYYNVTNISSNRMELAGNYEPNKYFFYDPEDKVGNLVLKWQLSQEKEASNIQYYSVSYNIINKNLVENADMQDDIGVYLYCPGFFYFKEYALLTKTPEIEKVDTYYKKVNPIFYYSESELINVPDNIPRIEGSASNLYNIDPESNYLYVRLDLGSGDYSFNEDGTVSWNSDLYENGVVKNIYIETDILNLDKENRPSYGRDYYVAFKEEAGESSVVIEDEETGALIPAISTTAYNVTKYRITVEPYMGNRYYRIGSSDITYYNKDTGDIISEEDYNQLDEENQINYQVIQSITSYELLTEEFAVDALTNDYKQQFKQERKKFIDYYVLQADPTETFYGPNRYWYNTYQDKLNTLEDKIAWEDGNTDNDKFAYGDWILDTNKKMTIGRQYYLNIIPTKEIGPFYYPNYYYYYDDTLEEYVLDSSPTMKENTIYYKKNCFYILEDKTGHFSKGAIWNYYNVAIPCILKIGSRKSIFEMQELVGFARTFNTIHGLILKINDLLETDDTLTRNTKTFQGCINTLNDIINRFDELNFNQILITDEIGRIVTKDLKDLEVAYGLNYSKKMTLSQMLNKFDEIENKVNNFTFITDEEMNSILEN